MDSYKSHSLIKLFYETYGCLYVLKKHRFRKRGRREVGGVCIGGRGTIHFNFFFFLLLFELDKLLKDRLIFFSKGDHFHIPNKQFVQNSGKTLFFFFFQLFLLNLF